MSSPRTPGVIQHVIEWLSALQNSPTERNHDTLRNGVSGMLYSLVGHGRPHRGAYRHGKCRGAYLHHGAYLHRGAYRHRGDMVVSIMELTVIVERTAMDT